jgi:hypothetical protein
VGKSRVGELIIFQLRMGWLSTYHQNEN